MLRITYVLTDGIPALRLEGKLVGPWVEELRTAIVAQPHLRLDLANVSFIDDAGVGLLNQLLRHGTTLAATSSFVAELLRTAAATESKEGARE